VDAGRRKKPRSYDPLRSSSGAYGLDMLNAAKRARRRRALFPLTLAGTIALI
jgi:hypothetical protein